MGSSSSLLIFFAFQIFLLMQITVLVVDCNRYKVGDLDAWNTPISPSSTPYTKWSKNHIFNIGDSLLFLYPPSQDSVIQVTEKSYNSCDLKDPILYMNDGNSLFNITAPGEFYFTSGVPGHCLKSQKLQISVAGGNGSSSAIPPTSLPATSPSYPTVFGSIPAPPSSSPLLSAPVLMVSAATGFLVALILRL